MSDSIISVEHLGKRYRIKHQAGNQRYTTLRDVIANNVKGLFKNRKLGIGIQKSEEDFWALKDVSFEVKRGEVVGIIGRNGAGKSTLLKVLSRITEPTTGRVHLKGRVASLLEVGTGFHPELTGRENVFLNGAILGMSRAEIRKKFDEIVAFAEVEKFLDTPVKRYSSGMYVRLAFAVAAHLEPEILIVDEVLAVGDAGYQEKCIAQMRKFAATGRTVLFVSHNMGVVLTLCHRGLLLENGTVCADGPAEQIVSSYFARNQAPTTARSEIRQNGIELAAFRVNGKDPGQIGDVAFAKPFELQLRLKSDRKHEAVRLQLSIYNSLETKVAQISSREMGPGSFTLDGDLDICVAVTHNALVPDKYRIDLQVKGPPEQPVLYHLPNVWQFSVSDRVLPGAWGAYTRENGVLYLESKIESKTSTLSSQPD
jgi:lipopolysaccharide transport system ATP-binding protein